MAVLQTIIIFICTNIYSLCVLFKIKMFLVSIISLAVFVLFNIFPSAGRESLPKIKSIKNGTRLLIVFLGVSVCDILWLVYCLFFTDRIVTSDILINSAIAAAALVVLFWNGIIRVYIHSAQLGIKLRVIGILVGWIFPINLFVLIKIIVTTYREYKLEGDKIRLDMRRAPDRVCALKYPILLVHGVFFRDYRFFNYWGRIPDALKANGAVIYYGNQQSAASVAECGRELVQRIEEVISESGAEKVNIKAHSKGGLDSRYAISMLGADKYVASLTTVNTPHRGCRFADFLLNMAPEGLKESVSSVYNTALKELGDKEPDFIAAVSDLTAEKCREFNNRCKNSDRVYYQSVGSKSLKAASSRFPLNFSYHLVKLFDGDNDGLVSVDSMKWGENFIFFKPEKKRGISHGDMIDLNRENINGFDVREAYVSIVKGLKEKGF